MFMLRPLLGLGSTATLLAVLTACGSSGDEAVNVSAADGAAAPAEGAAPVDGAAGRGAAGAVPGASGVIAAVSGTTLQVQNAQSGQVAVTYTDATAITAQVSGTLADVVVGSCVRITSADDQADTETTTATAVTVTAQVDGSCSAAADGGPGRQAGDAPADRPTDRPTDQPTDGVAGGGPAGDPRGGVGGRASTGEVSAVDGDSITVETVAPGETDSTSTVVLLDATTTYTTTQEADAQALAVGQCVVARGESDTTGAVTAETMSVSDAVDGVCETARAGRAGAGS